MTEPDVTLTVTMSAEADWRNDERLMSVAEAIRQSFGHPPREARHWQAMWEDWGPGGCRWIRAARAALDAAILSAPMPPPPEPEARQLQGQTQTVSPPPSPPVKRGTRVHVYKPYGGATEHDGKVATLFLPSNASAQVSALTEEDGFLIRVWPPNGTNEFGGSNMTVASMVVRFDGEGIAHYEKVEAHRGWPAT